MYTGKVTLIEVEDGMTATAQTIPKKVFLLSLVCSPFIIFFGVKECQWKEPQSLVVKGNY